MGKNERLSDSIRNILEEVYGDQPEKKALIDRANQLVDDVFGEKYIQSYVKEVEKIIEIEKGDDPVVQEMIEILGCLRKIIISIYDHLQEVKETVLNKNDRKFVQENVDLVVLVVISTVFDRIDDKINIKRELIVKILSFVQFASTLVINMKIRNLFFCCK